MPKKSSYKATLDEMFALQRFGIKLGLSTIRNILKNLPLHSMTTCERTRSTPGTTA